MATAADKAKLQKAIENLAKAQQKELDLQVKLNDVARNSKTIIDQRIDSADKFIKQLRTQATELAAYNETLKTVMGDEEEVTRVKDHYIDTLIREIEKLEEKDVVDKELLETKKETLRLIQEEQGNVDDLIKAYGDLADEQAKQNDAVKAARELNEATKQTAASILGLDSNWRQAGISGKFINAFEEGSSLADVVGQLGGGLWETIRPSNLMGAALTKIAAATYELNAGLMTSMGTLMESTTAGLEYTPVLANITDQNLKLNLGQVEAQESLGELLTNMKAFSALSIQSQEKLAGTTTVLRKFGVEAGAAGNALDVMVSSLKMTADEADETTANFVGLAHAIGEPPGVIFANIPKAQNMIAQFGKRGIDEFKKLSASSKALAIDLGSLLGVAEGFDTFETAADKVGSLNALLGGAYFDTVTMVAATEQERIRLLIEGVQAQGRSWESLDRWEKKALANAAGITDMTEANKLFGMSLGAYDELQNLATNSSMSLSDLSEEAFNNLSTQEKFETLLLRLTPVLDDLALALDTIVTGLSDAMDWMKEVTGGGAMFKGVMIGLMAVIMKGTGIFKLFTLPLTLLGSLYTALTGAAAASAPALTVSSKALYASNIAAKTAAIGMLKVAAAVALIGTGVGIATAGIGYLIESFGGLFKILGELPTEKIEALGNFMLKMSLAGMGGIVGAAGLGGLAIGLAAISASMAMLPTEELQSLSDLFENISKMSVASATSAAMAMAAIGKMNIGNADGLKEAAKMMKGLSEVDSATAISVSGVIKSAVDLANAKSNDKMLQFLEKLLEVLKQKGTAGKSQASTGAGGGQMLVVNLDGREVYKGMATYIEDDFVKSKGLNWSTGGD